MSLDTKNDQFDGFIPESEIAEVIDARELLVDARNLQNLKIWIKGFLTHYFRSILDNKRLRTPNLKFRDFYPNPLLSCDLAT